MATKVKPSRLQVTGTPQAGQVPVYVDENTFQWGAGGGSGDVVGPASSTDGHLAVFDGATGKIIKDGGAPTPVVDALNSTSSTSALSANQGKILNDKISDLFGLGKFLSLWDATTGLPDSFPLSTPYTYTTGDYYLVETVSSATPPVNYKPNGSSYTGTASTTVETDELEVGDVYIYDGSAWLLQSNHGKTVSFANIAGDPYDNTNLSNALADKQDELVSGTNIRTINGTSILGSGDITTPVGPTYTAGTGISIISDVIANTGVTSVNGNTGAVTLTIPTVNDATLTIQKNGTNVQTFTANQSTNATANITVPTDTGDLTNGAGFLTSSTGVTSFNGSTGAVTYTAPVTSVNGNTGAVTVNDVKSSATAPSTPTEGMLWYDTTNDVLKSYDGANWNEVGAGTADINTKTFYISSTSDTTNAQAAYDWFVAGKNPIIMYNNMAYIIYSSSASRIYFASSFISNATAGNSVTQIKKNWISFSLSSGTVTAININNDYGLNNYLDTSTNYTTPYTPLYDGSPATKKYVDDTANTKTFYLASDQDLTTAQAALDWYRAGKNPIVIFDSKAYFVHSFTNNINTKRLLFYGETDAGVDAQYSVIKIKTLYLMFNSGLVITSIVPQDMVESGFLGTATNYSPAYTPLYDGSPATKKYVDDNAFTATTGGVKIFDFPSVGDDVSNMLGWLASGGGAVMAENVTKYYTVLEYDDQAGYVTAINNDSSTSTTKVTINVVNSEVTSIVTDNLDYFEPSNAGSTGNVLTKTASGYQWAAPSGGGDVLVSSQANNILTSGMKIWAGTQANYEGLGSYDSNTVYLTIE